MNIHTDRCLKIDSKADAYKMPWHNQDGFANLWWCDYEKISQDYDAIWLTPDGEEATRLVLDNSLYGWDCETICILRSRAIDDMKIFKNGGLEELERRASVA